MVESDVDKGANFIVEVPYSPTTENTRKKQD